MYKKLILILSCTAPLYGVLAEFSVGDLFDRLTILEIKLQRITDPEKLKNVALEHDAVSHALKEYLQSLQELSYLQPKLDQLKIDLFDTNLKMWDIEDEIRAKEAQQIFDDEFITLARHVYFTNDTRCAIKRIINELTGSQLKEEKQYVRYQK